MTNNLDLKFVHFAISKATVYFKDSAYFCSDARLSCCNCFLVFCHLLNTPSNYKSWRSFFNRRSFTNHSRIFSIHWQICNNSIMTLSAMQLCLFLIADSRSFPARTSTMEETKNKKELKRHCVIVVHFLGININLFSTNIPDKKQKQKTIPTFLM